MQIFMERSSSESIADCISISVPSGLKVGCTWSAAVVLWDAMRTVIDGEGKVNGTCVGTGMAFDPAFYYYRPVSPYAAHAYGPAIFTGAEVIRLLDTFHPRMNDSAIQFYVKDYSDKGAIFSVD